MSSRDSPERKCQARTLRCSSISWVDLGLGSPGLLSKHRADSSGRKGLELDVLCSERYFTASPLAS